LECKDPVKGRLAVPFLSACQDTTHGTVIVCLPPGHLALTCRNVRVSKTGAACPPTRTVRPCVAGPIRVVRTYHSVSPLHGFVPRYVWYTVAIDFFEPFLHLRRVSRWRIRPVFRPRGASRVNWVGIGKRISIRWNE
jgi:hypothetical protein